MRSDLRPGNAFPDLELSDYDGKLVRLSDLMGGFPTIVVFSRGFY
jgi:peroxiredoxin